MGAAVGLGTIWRFPYLAGTHGGSTFVLVFIIACLAIATPLLVAEFMIGRRSGCNPADVSWMHTTAAHLALRSRFSGPFGLIGKVARDPVLLVAGGMGSTGNLLFSCIDGDRKRKRY